MSLLELLYIKKHEILIKSSIKTYLIKTKKNRCAEIGSQVPLRTEWFYTRASSSLVTYILKIKKVYALCLY